MVQDIVPYCRAWLKTGRGYVIMRIVVVINMKNPNALIAMAQVAHNASNPYASFCEYIKYCIFVNVSDLMTLTEIREAVGKEFGIYMPHNILIKCLMYIQDTGVISFDDHQIRRVGFFDTEAFNRERDAFRATEFAIIQALTQYASKFNREWTEDHARELLIKVLDRNGLAYDIFLHDKCSTNGVSQSTTVNGDIEEMLPDDEETEANDTSDEPLFTDIYFVGKFIEEILAGDTIQKDYLKKICEGLMLCVGTYQLPTTGASTSFPQITGTSFFFDTKLLLRFVGCAGEAAVSATAELVSLIQSSGGNIYYYPQTLQEMERAFDKAINSLTYGYAPRDEEMRLYAARIKNNAAIVAAKKASLVSELARSKIHLTPHSTFTEGERIRFGFEQHDLQQYMRSHLPWDSQVIDNDALAIWETHMRRQGDYSEYCGTGARLPVFVTTNSRLIGIALKFREDRQNTTAIYGWRQNRLPVITDIRLTCRLWSPAEHSERMSLLYLTANAVAAKRPTKRYIDSIRELAIQLGEQAPEYSGICLPAYFDDNVTESILEHTLGTEDNLNINSFATSIAELSEWKAKEQEEKTNQAIAERDDARDVLNAQTQTIIDGAVESSLHLIGWRRIALWLVVYWPITVTVIFTAITAGLSCLIGSWHPMWAVAIPTLLKIFEYGSASFFVSKLFAKWLLPKIECSIDKRIASKLRKAELPHKERIIQAVKSNVALWVKCTKLLEN